jgi:hypothetical protein
MTGDDEEMVIRRVMERLCTRFPDLDPAYVAHVVGECHGCFDNRPIRDFVPLLVERAAAQRLTGVTHHQAPLSGDRIPEAYSDARSNWLRQTFADGPAWAVL